MHEIALVNTAAAQLIAEVAGAPVSRVVMAIGPKVEEGVARQAFEIAVEGTSIASAELVLEAAMDGMKCFSCAKEFQGYPLDTCPDCGGTGLAVSEAEEVTITSWNS